MAFTRRVGAMSQGQQPGRYLYETTKGCYMAKELLFISITHLLMLCSTCNIFSHIDHNLVYRFLTTIFTIIGQFFQFSFLLSWIPEIVHRDAPDIRPNIPAFIYIRHPAGYRILQPDILPGTGYQKRPDVRQNMQQAPF